MGTLSKKILEKISRLKNIEEDSMDRFNTEIEDGEHASTVQDPIELVRSFQCYGNDGNFNLFDENVDGKWANASDDVPLLRQLLIDPRLIVDLKPVQNEDQCIATYGVTSSQLVKLVKRGFLSMNLYAYESGKSINFENYTSSECIGMPELLDYNRGKCRINSIRKEYFFNRILKEGKVSYEDLVSNYREKIKWLFDHISEEKRRSMIRKNIIREGDSLGNIETLAQQLAYNYSSMIAIHQEGDFDRYFKVKEILEKIEAKLTSQDHVEDTILKIRGLKNCIATPYTASMGGIYNMSSGAVKSLYEVVQIEANIQDNGVLYKKREEHKQVKAIIDFIEGTSGRFTNSELPMSPDLFRSELSSSFFEDYMDFIYLIRESTAKLNQTLQDLTKRNTLYDNYVKTGTTYFEIEEEIQRELKSYKKFRGILSYGISGVLTATTGMPDFSGSFIGFGLGGLVAGASKDSVQTLNVDNLVANDKRRILADLKKIRSVAEGS